MQPRTSLTVGATLAAAVALVVALVPADRLAGLLALAPDDAATFLVRRYAASATAAVAVTSLGIARGQAPERSALFGLATWFAVQALAAVIGLATGTVGGLAWLAVVADPVLATGFAILARRAGQSASKARHGPTVHRPLTASIAQSRRPDQGAAPANAETRRGHPPVHPTVGRTVPQYGQWPARPHRSPSRLSYCAVRGLSGPGPVG